MTQARFQLRIDKGPDVGQTFDLDSVTLTIGRDPMVDITITDPEVSRQHARLIQTLKGYQIQDLGSTNGTFIDGKRIGGEPVDLQPGQAISIGSSVVVTFEDTAVQDELLATVIDFSPRATDDATPDVAEGVAAASLVDAIEDERPAADVEAEASIEAAPPVEEAVAASAEIVEAEVIEAADPSTADDIEIVAAQLEEETGAAAEEWDNIIEGLPDAPAPEARTEMDFNVPGYEEYMPSASAVDEPLDAVEPVPAYEPPAEPEQIIATTPPQQEYRTPPPRQEPPIIPGDGEEPPKKNNRTPLIIGGVALLLLCCCCSLITFFWFVGGDLILQELNLLP